MSDGKCSIDDFQLVTTETVTSFTVSVSNIILFKSVNLQIRLINSSNNVVQAFPLTLSGTDYTNWGGDDTYLYQYVADKMGYTLSSAPVIPSPVPDVVDP